jgi:hypothetical protein
MDREEHELRITAMIESLLPSDKFQEVRKLMKQKLKNYKPKHRYQQKKRSRA